MIKAAQLTAENLRIGYGKRTVIDQLTIQIPANKISVLIGPNGCGKSTLIRALTRLIPLKEGTIYLNGNQLSSYNSKDIAKLISILPQMLSAPEDLTVYDLVCRGRYPYRSFFQPLSAEDHQQVEWALKKTQMVPLANRKVADLSGGQRQRAWLATILAQHTEIVFLDEPTTYLDIPFQLEILDLLKELNEREGTTIVIVLHELNLAARYADYLFAMKKGRIITTGPVSEVITKKNLKRIFQLESEIITDPIYNRPLIIPKSSVHSERIQ